MSFPPPDTASATVEVPIFGLQAAGCMALSPLVPDTRMALMGYHAAAKLYFAPSARGAGVKCGTPPVTAQPLGDRVRDGRVLLCAERGDKENLQMLVPLGRSMVASV